MMAPALDGTSSLNFLSHQGENSLFASGVLVFKLPEVSFDEGNIFDSLDKIPHSYLLVAFLLVALAYLFILFLSDSKQRSAGTGTLKVRSDRCDVKVFDHVLV